MKALRFTGGTLKVADIRKPEHADEATVRVTLAGICNTDLEIVRGYAGFAGTLGHEFVGVVESVPEHDEQTQSLIGKRVVGEINAGCGVCALCVSGDARHCPARTVLGIVNRDGAFAEYVRLPARNLIVVPREVTDEQAVFTEPLAAAVGITERVQINSETRVAVVGDGKLGLLCALALKQTGAPITLIGKHREKMRHARGCDTLIVAEVDKTARVFDVVVEASGSANGFALALDILRPRGTLVLKSTFQGATDIQAWRIVVDEISVIGSRCGRFQPALEMLKAHTIAVEDLIADEFALGEGVRAMERAAMGGVLKVLLRT